MGWEWDRIGLISAQYGARNEPLPDHDGTGLIEGTILVCFQPIISPGQKWDKKWASLWPDIGARPCQTWPVQWVEMGWDRDRNGLL